MFTHARFELIRNIDKLDYYELMTSYQIVWRAHNGTTSPACMILIPIRCTNVGLMLIQRLRRWTDIKPKLVKRFVFTGDLVGQSTITFALRRELIVYLVII